MNTAAIVASLVALAALALILVLVRSNRTRFWIAMATAVPVGLFLAVYFGYFLLFPGD